ncbi:hypothetical protein AB6A40_010109 [Gnathostoma spinigerum]|uniref:L-type lectin-like domain-containing protein n=1 Tax=Gnathostoma spinigerum TaxID=75299 RepID=A0ABD6F2S2_9BILA
MSDGLQPTPRYELCLRSENIVLPKNGYFGLSAATGGLADDHDVVDFSVFSMPTTVARPSSDKLQSAEKQKYEAEFEEQMKEYEKEKQKFKEQHPDKAQPGDEDWAKVHEDASQRELRLIYESQSAIYSVMQQMERKLDEIKQLQNAHTSMLQQGGAVLPQGGKPPVSSGDGFLQGEKAEVIQSLRDLTSGIREMKNYVNEIFTRTYNMEKKFSGGAVSTADSGLSTYLENIQNDIRSIKTSQFHQGGSGGTLPPVSGCPDPNCLSSSFFISVLALQSIVICILIVYKGKQEKAKFY